MSASLKYQSLNSKARSPHADSVPPTVQLLLNKKLQKLNIAENDDSQAATVYL